MIIYDDLVALDNNLSFLKIYDGIRPYYGGAQQWFRDVTLRKVGCSIVAATNITAYIAAKVKDTALFDYEDMSKDNFLKHMESIAEFIHPDAVQGVTSEKYFAEKTVEFAKSRGRLLFPNIITTKDEFPKIVEFIERALKEDKPIAMLMLKNEVLREFDWHWMTITKLFKDTSAMYVHISTWGESRVLRLEDFYKYSSHGALVYFDEIKYKNIQSQN